MNATRACIDFRANTQHVAPQMCADKDEKTRGRW